MEIRMVKMNYSQSETVYKDCINKLEEIIFALCDRMIHTQETNIIYQFYLHAQMSENHPQFPFALPW